MVKSLTPNPQWQELTLDQTPNPAQLDNIKVQLDLVLLALEALAGIGNDAMLKAATQLNLESKVPERIVALWRLRQSNRFPSGSQSPTEGNPPSGLSHRQGERGGKQLDVEEARSLVLITCYLAKQHQELIRRAVALLEQLAQENREPHSVAILRDYLDTFSNIYQERRSGDNISTNVLTPMALKLLIDLLFYSGPDGHRRLWSALLDRSFKGLRTREN